MKPVLGTMTFSAQVDQAIAAQMLASYKTAGHVEVDTAYVYEGGETELLLGRLQKEGALDGCLVAGKVNPRVKNGLQPSAVDDQLSTSLDRLNIPAFDLYYLHQPDIDTPIEDTLAAVYKHYDAGRFLRFGLSNYASWQVAQICELCKQNGWMQPVVYQGMYNALTRDVERELFHCLRDYDMGFYVYNPLAGGLLTGKHTTFNQHPDAGRFSTNTQYQDRYWKPEWFPVVEHFTDVCKANEVSPANAALRWLTHHSDLAGKPQPKAAEHAVVIGASSLAHFESNLAACSEDALPVAVVTALEEGWETVRASCSKYFRP